ncbi:hypothetical protein GCM10009747_18280 [Agromyces humatus]|uniref:DUF4232 domain-containing protein n=2 Tax=Agromyces humatus TaxID=279573 RepID=A0ABN2KMC1_9MICO
MLLVMAAALGAAVLAGCATAAPSPGAAPSPSAPSSGIDTDATLRCGDTPVPARALTEPRPATELSAEVLAVLENPLADVDEPLSDWLIAHETVERVVIMREREEPVDLGGGDIATYDLRAIEAADEHALPLDAPWGLVGAANCTPRIDLGTLTGAGVTLDPDALPDGGDERIVLLVTERECNSGRPATDRVELVELVETETTVEVVIGVRPHESGAFTCPSNPPTPFTVELEQPLGDRVIFDAAVAPAREISAGERY